MSWIEAVELKLDYGTPIHPSDVRRLIRTIKRLDKQEAGQFFDAADLKTRFAELLGVCRHLHAHATMGANWRQELAEAIARAEGKS